MTSPSAVTEALASAGLTPRRSAGQHFLVDANVLRIITDAAHLEPFDSVIEVGPGPGALTQALIEQAGRVYAVESDPGMVRILEREFGEEASLVVTQADALEFDPSSFWEGAPPDGVKMVSNLPYQIAATLLVRWLRDYAWIGEYTVMVQREVAERIAAGPGGRDYSSASVKIQYRATVSRVARVSRNCFMPRPRVDSSILHLERRPVREGAGEVRAQDEGAFDSLVTAAFRQRRKKLANSAGECLPGTDRSRVAEALAGLGLSPGLRAEDLSPGDFARLSNVLASE